MFKIKFVILIVTFSIYSSFVFSGKEEGGAIDSAGGDFTSISFVNNANELVKFLKSTWPPGMPKFDVFKLEQVIKTAKVESTDKILVLKGIVKDAINSPGEMRILVNRKRWSQIDQRYKKNSLVLHEYLNLMGLDDSKYQYSSHFLNMTTTSIGKYVGYYRRHMNKGFITCKNKNKLRLLIDMNTKHLYLFTKDNIFREKFKIRNLDTYDKQKGRRIVLNILAELLPKKSGKYQNGKLQLISTNAIDSSRKGKFSSIISFYLIGIDGHFGTTLDYSCRSGFSSSKRFKKLY